MANTDAMVAEALDGKLQAQRQLERRLAKEMRRRRHERMQLRRRLGDRWRKLHAAELEERSRWTVESMQQRVR